MNTLRNRVQLIGHVGADPEVKDAQNGSKLAHVRMATTERYLSGGAWKEDTQWHRADPMGQAGGKGRQPAA